MDPIILFGPQFVSHLRPESQPVKIRIVRYPNSYLPVLEVEDEKGEWVGAQVVSIEAK